MDGEVIFLSENTVDLIQVIKPLLNFIKLLFELLFKLFADFRYLFLDLNEFLTIVSWDTDWL